MLHAGDLINNDDSDAEWGEWFGAGGWLNGMIPVVATPGNHEYNDDYGLSRHWRPQFAFPMNGPSGLEETVYWFDYQGARIISLNSNERIDEQRHWLKSVLADTNRPEVDDRHVPPPDLLGRQGPRQPRAPHRLAADPRRARRRPGAAGPRPRATPAPDSAVRKRTSPAEACPRAKSSNTVYVVSVSGPKMYQLQGRWDVSRDASGVQLFQVIHVAPERSATKPDWPPANCTTPSRSPRTTTDRASLRNKFPKRPVHPRVAPAYLACCTPAPSRVQSCPWMMPIFLPSIPAASCAGCSPPIKASTSTTAR